MHSVPEQTAELRALAETHLPTLRALSQYLHAHPELSFEEHRSVARFVELLAEAGYSARTAVHGVATAFRAEAGSSDQEVIVCAEYDGLPGVGQACGHNLIAAAAFGAFLVLAPFAEQLGIRVVLLGTPAEEHGAGKELLLRAGAWDDAIASMMVHPSPKEMWPGSLSMISVHRLRATFRGRAAHAAAAPEQGINAADAATLAQVAVGLLRQQTRESARLNTVIRSAGEATNIIADTAVVDVEVRELTDDALVALEHRLRACFEGAAVATGCAVEIVELEPLYRHFVEDPWLGSRFGRRYASLGHDVHPQDAPYISGSTDMGNVSQVVPSIHPLIALPGAEQLALHTHEFAEAAGRPEALEVVLDAVAALCGTVVDLASDTDERARLLRLRAERRPSGSA